jgi:hypothetical protein
MTDIAGSDYPVRARAQRARPRRPIAACAAVGLPVLGAIAFIAYVLWPRWPGASVAPDAPAIPITIAGVAFNVPAAAIRVAMQRRPGAHERVDLVFLWPSLALPDPAAKPAAPAPDSVPAPLTAERVFVTITSAGATLAPAERVKVIYPRYTAAEAATGPDGLAVLAFRAGTPYEGEDLIYDAAAGGFVVRCTRNGAGPTPGTCLYQRRIEGADVTVRFARDWLADWRAVAAGIERLIAKLRPPAG